MAIKKRSALKIPARDIERTVLDNGVRVISERVKGSPSALIGLWVDSGSRYEELNESGSTHLIQRMALHGAGDRSPDRIAKNIDRLGGEFETETFRDAAVYQMRVSPDDVKSASSLLADITLRPILDQTGLGVESEILLEELRSLEKDADSVLERMFLRSLWKGHGVCRDPKGRLLFMKGQSKLESFRPKNLQAFHKRSHHPEALTFIATGNVRHDQIEKLAEKLFGSLEQPKRTVSTTTPRSYKFLALRSREEFPKVRFEIGFPACAAAERERHAATLLNAAIGAGPGSSLGVLAAEGEIPALSISSTLRAFDDVGCISIRSWAGHKDIRKVIKKVTSELWRIAANPLDSDQLERARATRKAALLGDVESLRSRAAGLARAERYHGRIVSLKDEFEKLEAVTAKEIQKLASMWINPYQLSMAVLGNGAGLEIDSELMERR